MYSAASRADESPKGRTNILRTQAVAVDASPVRGQLHETPDDLLVPLLLSPAPHFSSESHSRQDHQIKEEIRNPRPSPKFESNPPSEIPIKSRKKSTENKLKSPRTKCEYRTPKIPPKKNEKSEMNSRRSEGGAGLGLEGEGDFSRAGVEEQEGTRKSAGSSIMMRFQREREREARTFLGFKSSFL